MARILVVDDDNDHRAYVVQLVERLGHTAASAENGQRCLNVLREQEVDAIITDIFMPNIDGLEFLTQLATKGFTFPVIAITGQNDSSYVNFLKVARNFGVFYSIEKKDMERDLVRLVPEILEDRLERDDQNQPFG